MQHSVFSVCLPLHVFLLLVCVCFSVVIGVCVCVCVCVCRVKWCRCICRDTCRRAHTQLHMTSIKVISLQTTCCWLKPTVSHKHTHTLLFSFLLPSAWGSVHSAVSPLLASKRGPILCSLKTHSTVLSFFWSFLYCAALMPSYICFTDLYALDIFLYSLFMPNIFVKNADVYRKASVMPN